MKIALKCLCIAILFLLACKKPPKEEAEIKRIISNGRTNVSGIVRDIDGTPLADVEVKVDGTEILTFTDAKGVYTLINLKIEKISVSAIHDDFTVESKEIDLIDGKNTLDFDFNKIMPLEIVSKTDGYTAIPDSVSITFNRQISVSSLKSNHFSCNPGSMGYSISNWGRTVRFKYSCLKLGGSFPFTIVVKDKFHGETSSINFTIDYFTQKVDFQNPIRDFIISEDDRICWTLVTEGANAKIVGISLKTLNVVKSYPVSNTANKLIYNAYNRRLYILTSSQRILQMDIETGAILKEIRTNNVPGSNANVPYQLHFAKNGYGVLITHNPVNPAFWRVNAIESDKSDAMSVIQTEQYQLINGLALNNFSKNHFYLFSDRNSSFYILDATTKELKPVSLDLPEGPHLHIFSSKVNNKALFVKGGKTFVVDPFTGQVNPPVTGGFLADFSYRENEENLFYTFDSSQLFKVNNYLNGRKIRGIETDIPRFIPKMIATSDGEFLIMGSANELLVFSTSMFGD